MTDIRYWYWDFRSTTDDYFLYIVRNSDASPDIEKKIENKEWEAVIGKNQNTNVEFLNDSTDVAVVLIVADKIRELGFDKN